MASCGAVAVRESRYSNRGDSRGDRPVAPTGVFTVTPAPSASVLSSTVIARRIPGRRRSGCSRLGQLPDLIPPKVEDFGEPSPGERRRKRPA